MLKQRFALIHEEFLTVVVVADLDAVRLCHFCHFVELVRDFDGFCLVAERRACPDDGLAAELGNLFDDLFCRLCVDGDNLKAGLFQPFFDVLHVVIEVDRQQLDARKAEGRDGLEFIEQRGPEAEIARDAAERICTDIDFHVNFPNRNKFVKNKFIYQVKSYHIHK